MRHRIAGRRLNRTPAHLKAMKRNLVAGLFERFGTSKEYIFTTLTKAKECRPFAERLITLGKDGTLPARRRAAALLGDKPVAVKKLFAEIAPRYATRGGGYLRILRLANNRLGDNSPRAMVEFVKDLDSELKHRKKGKKARHRPEVKVTVGAEAAGAAPVPASPTPTA